jgi:hypothetical protein
MVELLEEGMVDAAHANMKRRSSRIGVYEENIEAEEESSCGITDQ